MNRRNVRVLAAFAVLTFIVLASPMMATGGTIEGQVIAQIQQRLTVIAALPEAQRVAAIDRMVHRGACRNVHAYYQNFARRLKHPNIVGALPVTEVDGQRHHDRFLITLTCDGVEGYERLVFRRIGACRSDGCLEIVRETSSNIYTHWRHGHDDAHGMRHAPGRYYKNDEC